jgi:RNA polymerase sigma-70 factor (ECF subfamily)
MESRNAGQGSNLRACASTGAEADTRSVSSAIAAAQRGEGDGVRYLYVRFADEVYGFVRSIIRDEHEAEDVTQQIFANLPGRIARYEQRAVPFKAWLLRVARNAALDALRGRRSTPAEEVFSVEQPSDDRGLGAALSTALGTLPPDQREVIVLRHVVGLSPGEIARRLDKSEGAIHGLHHRGRRALKLELRQLGATPSTA